MPPGFLWLRGTSGRAVGQGHSSEAGHSTGKCLLQTKEESGVICGGQISVRMSRELTMVHCFS